MSKKPKKSDLHKFKGLYPVMHYKYNRNMVDQDYIDQLNDEEKEWLATFNDNYYGGRYRADNEKNVIKDTPGKRETYRNKEYRRYDIYAYDEDRKFKADPGLLDEVIDNRTIENYAKSIDASHPHYFEYLQLLQTRESKRHLRNLEKNIKEKEDK